VKLLSDLRISKLKVIQEKLLKKINNLMKDKPMMPLMLHQRKKLMNKNSNKIKIVNNQLI